MSPLPRSEGKCSLFLQRIWELSVLHFRHFFAFSRGSLFPAEGRAGISGGLGGCILVISKNRTLEWLWRAEHSIPWESRVDLGSVLGMTAGLHPHLMGLHHLTQPGITQQLDSGIYLLYPKKEAKYFHTVSHWESPTPAAKTKCSDLIPTKLCQKL